MSRPAGWEYAGDRGWSAYGPRECAELEAAWANAPVSTLRLSVGRRATAYDIDFSRMAQRNASTQTERPIRRRAAGTLGAPWQFASDAGWTDLDAHSSAHLSATDAVGRDVTTLWPEQSRWHYEVDLRALTQTNVKTSTVRPIRRPDGASASSSGVPAADPGTPSGAGTGPVVRVPLPLVDTYTAPNGADVLSAINGWRSLKPADLPDGVTDDPITCESLGADGEEIVEMPCSTAATRCIFNRVRATSSPPPPRTPCARPNLFTRIARAQSTAERALISAPRCPICAAPYPALHGPQPSGSASIHRAPRVRCDGHGPGALIVTYSFDSGIQGAQHPEPGQLYKGTTRECIYPDDDVGWLAVTLLRRAFARGALFRVGDSATTGSRNTTVWAVHQKTSASGGAVGHGWPDAGFLDRLRSELASAGVPID